MKKFAKKRCVKRWYTATEVGMLIKEFSDKMKIFIEEDDYIKNKFDMLLLKLQEQYAILHNIIK